MQIHFNISESGRTTSSVRRSNITRVLIQKMWKKTAVKPCIYSSGKISQERCLQPSRVTWRRRRALPEPRVPLEPGLTLHCTWAPPGPTGPRAGGCHEAGLQPPRTDYFLEVLAKALTKPFDMRKCNHYYLQKVNRYFLNSGGSP